MLAQAEQVATSTTAPIPIFVIGLNRSGTKWLSNELAAHPDIACVLSEKTGIRETNMFRCFGRKFDLTKFDDFVGMVELWSETDFFERTAVDKELLYQLDPLPVNHYALFGALMEIFAKRQGKQFWLQKGPPLAGFELMQQFPNALFVVIRREMHDQIRSHIKLSNNRSLWNLTRATFAFVRDSRLLDRFCKKCGCPAVQYTELASNKNELLSRLVAGWKLAPFTDKRADGFALVPNSSFDSSDSREQYLSRSQRTWISVIGNIFRLIPYGLMYWSARRSWRRHGSLIPGTFDNIHRRLPGFRDRFYRSDLARASGSPNDEAQ